MNRARTAAFLPFCIGIALVLPARPLAAADSMSTAAAGGAFRVKGYVNARYMYVGSSAAATVYSGMRMTGSLQISALSDKIVLKYRSHHWVNFERPASSVLESPFENRHIVQTVSLEANGLLARGLNARIGRFFPEMDYASCPVIDGGAASLQLGGFSIGGAAGRMVDLWDNARESRDVLAAGQLKYRAERFGASTGFQSASSFGRKQREVSGGFNLIPRGDVWLDAYGGYDFEFKEMTRAGLSLSVRRDAASLSLMASQWRNPFDQIFLVDKGQNLAYWGLYSKEVPSTYNDLRLSGAYGGRSWSLRGSVGSMSGVRTGWTANAYLTTPAYFGLRGSIGAQGMKTDYIDFYSIDGTIMTQIRAVTLQMQSQTRNYQWRPRPSGFRNMDNYTEVSAEYPLRRHFYLSTAFGGFFRTLGNESFKPQAELRIIARI